MCEVFLVYVRVSDWPFYFRIMLKAIEDVLNDEHFHIPLEPAAMAFKQATCMFQWIVLVHQRMAGTLLAVEKEEPATVKSSAKSPLIKCLTYHVYYMYM